MKSYIFRVVVEHDPKDDGTEIGMDRISKGLLQEGLDALWDKVSGAQYYKRHRV